MKGGKSTLPDEFRFTSNPVSHAGFVNTKSQVSQVANSIPDMQIQGVRRPHGALERAFMPADVSYSDAVFEAVKVSEALRNKPYPDPGVGYPTIGYGHKLEGEYDPNMFWSESEATEQLRRDMNKAAQDVRKLVKVPITQGQMDALTSLFMNMGSAKFPGTQADKKLHAGDYAGAATELLTFDNVRKNGKLVPLAGLTSRRRWEAEMFAGRNKHLLPPDRPKTQ